MSLSRKIDTIKALGLHNSLVGIYRKSGLIKLCREYGVPEWHGSNPVELREYAQEVIRIINEKKTKSEGIVVEVGCGIGDLLNKVSDTYERIGYDIDKNAIALGRHLFPKLDLNVGSFGDVKAGKIDFLIMVDMSFGITSENIREYLRELMDNNSVETIIMDTYSNNKGTEYMHSHDGNMIFEGRYKQTYRSRSIRANHGASRYIEVWEYIEQNGS